jgi:isopenicillin-N N-acyltransferase-like protein
LSIPILDLSGSPSERVLQHGRGAGDLVARSIEIYRKAFRSKGVSWERAREVATALLPEIAAFDRGFADEIRGIADGAEVPVEDVVALNARTELLYGQHPQVSPGPDTDGDGCTGAIALPGATRDGIVIHGQNWDWRDECADSCLLLRIRSEEGPDILCFTEGGLLARFGFNSAGIALTANFLQTERDYGRKGIPIALIRRRILMARSLSEAIRVPYSVPRAFSANLMLSDAGGAAIDLETTPDEIFWQAPENDLLVHANHFVTLPARIKNIDMSIPTSPDSLYRDLRVRAHLESRHGDITTEDFRIAFGDRFGAPRAVCRSPIEGPGGKVSSTVATIIMSPSEGRIWIAKRPYASAEFTEHRL